MIVCKVREGAPNGGTNEFVYVDDEKNQYAWGFQDGCAVITKKLEEPVTETDPSTGVERQVEWTPIAMFPVSNVLFVGVFPDPPKQENPTLVSPAGFRPPPDVLSGRKRR